MRGEERIQITLEAGHHGKEIQIFNLNIGMGVTLPDNGENILQPVFDKNKKKKK